MTSPTFPFTELPESLQHHVVSKMHIHERLRLAHSTRRYKRPNDDKLAVLHLGVKKKQITRQSLSDNIQLFLLKNATDPTVMECATLLGFELPTPSASATRKPQTFLDQMAEWLSVTPLRPIPHTVIELTHRDVDTLNRLIGAKATPLHFERLYTDPQYSKWIRLGQLIFEVITCANEPLLAYWARSGDVMLQSELRNVVNEHMLVIYAYNAKHIRLIYKYCQVPPESKEALITKAFQDLNSELVAFLRSV